MPLIQHQTGEQHGSNAAVVAARDACPVGCTATAWDVARAGCSWPATPPA